MPSVTPTMINSLTSVRRAMRAGYQDLPQENFVAFPVKVDIEGAEIEVFDSCPWIKRVQVTAIELHERVRPGCSADVRNAAVDFRCDRRGEIMFVTRQPFDASRRNSTDLSMGGSAPQPLPAV
jgi:hypothetical protein